MDLNKTTLTHKLTAAAGVWLSNACARPAVTELSVSGYGIADLGALLSLNAGTAVRLRLPLGWHTCIVEVKSTRADYRSDGKFARTPVVNVQFLVTPKGLLSSGEAPGWGILEQSGCGLRIRRKPEHHTTAPAQQIDFLLSLISTLHWRKTNERFRAYRATAAKAKENHNAVRSWTTAAWRLLHFLESNDEVRHLGFPKNMLDRMIEARRVFRLGKERDVIADPKALLTPEETR